MKTIPIPTPEQCEDRERTLAAKRAVVEMLRLSEDASKARREQLEREIAELESGREPSSNA